MGQEVFDKYEKLEAEIKREKADALRRAGKRLEEALVRLADLRETIEALSGNLIIQREAVGFYDHRDVERLYRVPDPIEDVRD